MFSLNLKKYSIHIVLTSVSLFFLICCGLLINQHYRHERGVLHYFLNHQKTDGSYTYVYFPKKNTSGYGYSLIRHFGALYALSDYASTLQVVPSTLENHLRNGVSYGLTFSITCDSRAPTDALCLNYEHDGSVFGTPSLAIVTLLKSRELINTTQVQDEYLTTSIALEKGISFRFNNGHLLYSTTTTKRIRRFEEGQLLLALVHLQQATNTTYYFTKSTQLKNVLSKKIINSGDVSLHHWYVLALRDYYRVNNVEPTKAECDYFIKSTSHLNSLQELHGELAGSFKEDPLIATGEDTYKQHDPTITSAYVEGVGALYEIMSYCTQSQEIIVARILSKKIIDLAMHHINIQQVTIHDVLFKGFSFRSLGGIHRNDSSNSIQIDTPQHALSAYIVANKINSERK